MVGPAGVFSFALFMNVLLLCTIFSLSSRFSFASSSFCSFVMKYQLIRTRAVQGRVKAQYTQNRGWMIGVPCQSSIGVENRAAKNVAGRKSMVMTAMVFMDELSFFAARAMVRESLASSMLALTSCRAMRLKS